jgi:hypothetical protein
VLLLNLEFAPLLQTQLQFWLQCKFL